MEGLQIPGPPGPKQHPSKLTECPERPGFAPVGYEAHCVDRTRNEMYVRSYYEKPVHPGSAAKICQTPAVVRLMARAEQLFEDAHRTAMCLGFGDLHRERRPLGESKVRKTPRNHLYLVPNKDGMFSLNSMCDPGDDVAIFYAGKHAFDLDLVHEAVSVAFTQHEMHHFIQKNVMFPSKRADCNERKPTDKTTTPRSSEASRQIGWWLDGTADAYGMWVARQRFAPTEVFGPYENGFYRRFFLARRYDVPLNFAGPEIADDHNILFLLDYRTNGFWLYIIERFFANDPVQLEGIYRALRDAYDNQTDPTAAIHHHFDRLDGRGRGLGTVLPQFLSEYLTWPRDRFNDQMPMDRWLSESFGGCRHLRLTPERPAADTAMALRDLSGQCIEVTLTGFHKPVQLSLAALGADLAAVDGLSLGWAETLTQHQPTASCARDMLHRPVQEGPCLLAPALQGQVRTNGPALPAATPQGGEFIRIWQLGDDANQALKLELPTAAPPPSTHDLTLRFVLTRVSDHPSDWTPDKDNWGRGTSINFAVTVDQATMEQPTSDPKTSDPKTSDAPTDEPHTALFPAIPGIGIQAHSTFAPLPVAQQPDNPWIQAALGDNLIGLENHPDLRGVVGGAFLQMSVLDPGQSAADLDAAAKPTLVVILEDKAKIGLTPGETGTFRAVTILRHPEDPQFGIYLNDERQASTLAITEYNFLALRFHGTAAMCRIDPSNPLLGCVPAPPREFSGSVSFPTLRMHHHQFHAIETADIATTRNLSPPVLNPVPAAHLPPPAAAQPPTPDPSLSANGSPATCDCSCAGLAVLESPNEANDLQTLLNISTCAGHCVMHWAYCE